MTLRARGLGALAIMDLGGWEDIRMVLRYTRAYDKRQSKKFYKPIIDTNSEVDSGATMSF